MKKVIAIELLKLKRTKIWWLVLGAPVFMVIQGAINLLRYYDLFTGRGQNLWEQLYTQSMIFYVSILFPLLISLVMALWARVEYAQQGWKYYFSLPVKRGQIYGVKFAIACGFIFFNVLALLISLIVAGILIGAPENIPYQTLIVKPITVYGSALPLMAFFYVLSLRFSSLMVPLAMGIGGALPAMLVANTKFWLFYPWTYPIMVALGGEFDIFHKGSLVFTLSVALLIVIIFWGYRQFQKWDFS